MGKKMFVFGVAVGAALAGGLALLIKVGKEAADELLFEDDPYGDTDFNYDIDRDEDGLFDEGGAVPGNEECCCCGNCESCACGEDHELASAVAEPVDGDVDWKDVFAGAEEEGFF